MKNVPSISLANILAGIVFVDPTWDRAVLGIASDSRKVEKDYIFLACAGMNVDGRRFIPEAIARGACAVIAEGDLQAGTQLHGKIPVFVVNNIAKHISKIAARFYHHPSRVMRVIGVTGTNGKTSITHFLAQCLLQSKQSCGVIGTLGYGIYDHLIPGVHTTPDAITVQRLLAEIAAQGAKTVAMEVSSHSLEQYRVKQVQFEMGIFTNLTRDHLDFHESMEAYGEAKLKLFHHLGMRYAILNEDDVFTKTILKSLSPSIQVLRYSLRSSTVDVYADQIQMQRAGIQFQLHTPWGKGTCQLNLLGQFNISNMLAVVSCLGLMGFSFNDIVNTVSHCRGVPGRMQTFRSEHSPTVILDYAHTPDALQQALLSIRAHQPRRLFCVFGCGGDRDPGKRPLMGRIAEQLSDVSIITNDNPRTEIPEAISREIADGYHDPMRAQIILDRKAAIQAAIAGAQTDDMVLVAGKGHENVQIIGEVSTPFSDADCIQAAIAHSS